MSRWNAEIHRGDRAHFLAAKRSKPARLMAPDTATGILELPITAVGFWLRDQGTVDPREDSSVR